MAAPMSGLDASISGMHETLLSNDVIRSMGIASVWGPVGPLADEQCNGISFSDSGVMCCSSHNDGALRVMRGDGRPEERSEYFIKDIGCRLVTYTHHEACVLHTASLGEGDARGYISYHSLHDNKILRYFRGHTDYVTALCMSPDSDKFLTASKDGSFRLWDLRSPTAEFVGDIGATGSSTASFDNTGLVFGVASANRTMSLYDMRKLSQFYNSTKPLLQYTVHPTALKGPDGTPISTPPPLPPTIAWTGMEFSLDNRYIALAANDRGILLLDSLKPNRELALLQSHPIDPTSPCNLSFSPDGKFLATGGCDGHIYVYDLTGKPPGVKLGSELGPGEDLPELPYAPRRWEPTWNILGEGHKTPAASSKAREIAGSHMSKIYAVVYARWLKKADLPLPACPVAATAEEQVSRHDGPVRTVRWHPRAAVLASGSQSIAVWTSAPIRAPSTTS